MKEFACGSVMPGCTERFRGETEEEILGQVAVHAREAHGIGEVPPELIARVRGGLVTLQG